MGSWSRLGRSLAVGALTAAIAFSTLAVAPIAHAKAPAGVAGTFADTWQAIGASTLGAPVTPPIEVDGHLMQYFAYGALIEVDGVAQRYAVGNALADASHNPDGLVQGRRGGSSAASASFSQVAGSPFQVSLGVSEGYERLGGADRFGQPISQSATVAGQQVQWFEYGRIVWSPRATGGVQALDGWELARALGLPVAREVSPVVAELPAAIETETLAPSGFTPVRIAIPAIGVDASIEQVGIVNSVMQTPEGAWNVGWYQETSLAGGSGNAVFAAHRDWWGVGPVVFARLNELGYGDTITVVGADGQSATYIVTAAYAVLASADFTPLISSGDANEITLITCSGNWDGSGYTDRLIVQGVLA